MRVPYVLLPTAIFLAATPAMAGTAPTLTTNHSCYLVGTPVTILGAGFAASRPYQVSLDGVDFGTSTTDASGAFHATLRPGGLGANVVQQVDTLRASDGASVTRATFTVTRAPGARILTSGLRAPFQVWGFALGGGRPRAYAIAPPRRTVYLHYVSPRGRAKTTVRLGTTGGQCGYLETAPRRVFAFSPTRGTWTLQVDGSPRYASHPAGPVARISVSVG